MIHPLPQIYPPAQEYRQTPKDEYGPAGCRHAAVKAAATLMSGADNIQSSVYFTFVERIEGYLKTGINPVPNIEK